MALKVNAHAPPTLARSCPRGYETRVSGTGASSCTPCAKGFYNGAANSAFCLAAPAGAYVPAPASTTYKLCDAGYVTGLTATENNSTGQYATAASKCDPCPSRQYRAPGSANKCLSCPAGRAVWVAAAATKCDPCPAGSTLLKSDDLKCTTCPTGEMSDMRCVAWHGGDGPASAVAAVAPPWSAVQQRLLSCTTHSPSIASHSESPAHLPPLQPPAGTFMPSVGKNGTCTPCAAGYFTSDLGNTKCDACDPGTFANVTGSSKCTNCAIGEEGARDCWPDRAICALCGLGAGVAVPSCDA